MVPRHERDLRSLLTLDTPPNSSTTNSAFSHGRTLLGPVRLKFYSREKKKERKRDACGEVRHSKQETQLSQVGSRQDESPSFTVLSEVIFQLRHALSVSRVSTELPLFIESRFSRGKCVHPVINLPD